jgi:hypothetical protein
MKETMRGDFYGDIIVFHDARLMEKYKKLKIPNRFTLEEVENI